MFKRRFLTRALPLLIFIVLVFFLWIGLYHNPREIPSPLINKPTPEFRVFSLLQPKQHVTQEIFVGQVTILNVFATWCVACQAEHSVLMEGRDLKGVQIIGLDYKDNHYKAISWLSRYGNPYNQVIDDPTGSVGINFGVYGTPETFIIDRRGIIRYKFIGAVSPADWKSKLLPEIKKWLD
jgi:cytochrome c biogenesis protein CcmG, thiol:disulfide interchange protein DsbE